MGSRDRRIVLLGKTGVGKSSTGNTIFGGENVFKTKSSSVSTTHECETQTRTVEGREITLIDPPGFFDTEIPNEDDLRKEMLRCITECAPGPHAFVILLKARKFTTQEQEVIQKIQDYFSPEAFKHAVVVLTHGYDLKGQTAEQFVEKSESLSALVEKCGGRCHVLDNKYWNKQQEGYASNTFQVRELLSTIDQMVETQGGCYTNEALQAVDEGTQADMIEIEKESEEKEEKMSKKELKEKAKKRRLDKLVIRCAGIATGLVVGALLGVAMVADVSVTLLFKKAVDEPLQAGGGVAAAAAAMAGLTAATGGAAIAATAGVVFGLAALSGAIEGMVVGGEAAKEAQTVGQAMKKASAACKEAANFKKSEYLNNALKNGKASSQPEDTKKESEKKDSP